VIRRHCPARAGGCTPDTPTRQDGGHARDPRLDQTSLDQRLTLHAKEHWPQLVTVHVRYHGQFAYVEGQLIDGGRLPLMRLRYGGSATYWGLAIHTPSNDRYEAAPWFTGTPQEALNLVCDLYVTGIDT
jgi:hypothetical protein